MEEKNKKVLLIEDEEMIVNLLRKELEKGGYQVEVAGDGNEGLTKIYSFEPDLVLLDLLLPHKTGYELLRELHEKSVTPKLAVIVISNSNQPSEVERLTSLGAREILTKINFNPADVVEKVDTYFEVEERSQVARHDEIIKPNGAKTKVLIVEDDPFIGELVTRKFNDEGFDVRRAIDAVQARAILDENGADIVLLDVLLPGKDGISFLKELRAEEVFKDLPIVIASNLGQQEEIDAGLNAGANDYIIKANFMPSEIVEKVREHLHLSSQKK